MNSNQHRCMNQAPASENQTQQRSLNSSLEDTVGSPLVHLGGMLLNGSTSILPNSPLQPSVTSITYGPWYTTFATSLILDGPILPCMGIPSRVNVPGNEVADFLAKSGCSEIATTDYALTYRDIYSSLKIKDKQVWIAPPDHSGISRKSPGGALEFDGNINDQMAVSRLLSGHLKGMTFQSGRKVFQTCSKCHLLQASPEYILDCLGIALEDVHASPLLVLDFARVNGLMDLI
ncbi:RNase H domain-containing protein [Trichonephila clavipes]|nr:RNase H domain-containing protein [Trichonephila clavipes]